MASFPAPIVTGVLRPQTETEDGGEVPELNSGWEGQLLETVEVTPELVQGKLKTLKPTTSPGPDGIHSRVLKELATPLSLPVSILFKKSIESGQVPEAWKQGEVVPIFKAGNRQEVSNYRPVSLTSVLSKVLEAIIKDELLVHFKESGVLSDAQHGFLPGRSCTTQLLATLEDWTRSLERGVPVDVAYLDFRKAFDSVPHRRLIKKLYGLGVREPLLAWLEAFLTGRNQRVVVSGTRSSWSPVKSGIPQGTVLGPILFLAYVNDLPTSVESNTRLFADDTKLYRGLAEAGDRDQLQTDLDSLVEWSEKWLLPFNQSKCKILHLGRRNQLQDYTIQGNVLKKVTEEKDLGVFVDGELKYRRQAAAAVSRANQVLGIIRRSFEHLDAYTLPLLYKTLVRPLLEYGNAVWGPFNRADQRLVERVQRRATRLVPDVRHLPYEDRLRVLKIPSMHYRRRRGDMILIFMLMKGHLDLKKEDFFQAPESENTRGHPMKVAKPRAVTRMRRNHWSVRSVNDWNSLPSQVVLAPTVYEFKSLLDDFWSSHVYVVLSYISYIS